MTYVQRRIAAIALAAAYRGWGRPPTPEGTPPRIRIIYNGRAVENTSVIDAHFAAKERKQNREKFK